MRQGGLWGELGRQPRTESVQERGRSGEFAGGMGLKR